MSPLVASLSDRNVVAFRENQATYPECDGEEEQQTKQDPL